MSKRANGEGNVRQRADGRWEASVSYVDAVTDKRRRTYVYGKTAAEARRELKKVRERIEGGKPAKDAPELVATWLQRWRESSLEASDRKATTKSLYASLSRTHLESGPVGAKRLDRLKPSDVEALIVELRGKKLADSTVRQVYTVLRQSLDVAVRDGLLASNPAAKVKRPGVARQEARYLPAEDVAKLLDAAKGLRYYVALVLMASTGLRRGEVTGLLWSDVDLDKGELTVRHTLSRVDGELVLTEPKTARSRRRVPLHSGVVTALKGWRRQQLKERLVAGDQWTDTKAVFCTELGTMVDPRNMLRTVELAAKKAGIEDVGAHTMRHSAAVAWLESGVHIKAAADLLGHSSIAITGDLYGHTSDDTARAAVDGLGAALGL
ncbi:tyrosine-type recombinase/integrase [Mycobacteroides abscessus]|uniref:tyrosine-type recombinase/integrase n=1 Tax=Mycobacteroides abscessus TaxID=36809 RepID=UPI00092B0089|nr:site-specific integrase [Mycobacteroides abscessus]MBN7544902.1 site-specific integrase [Mycobacteroides abscessus subsp. abscessus]QSM96386.1 site-specific integrase [Mycobacteroides abscessus subsp. abscessus]QSN01418.1 site-specific integrase [Mycobacteroides abscessus subsp. abscessus]SHU73074.1 phage integrase family protein [Mycobacteroides abscessus subsp. abscessus]SHV33326.1 phage integrase family protein [Mycobacteroides abscessus subsp. abscessus]